jgi:hypothetical protein
MLIEETSRKLRISGGSTMNLQSLLSLSSLKAILQTGLTAVTVLSWLIPLISHDIDKHIHILGLGNAFAGGVFLMLGIGHMIPASLQTMHKIGLNSKYTYYSILLGYALILFVEKVAFASGIIQTVHTDDKLTNKITGMPIILSYSCRML